MADKDFSYLKPNDLIIVVQDGNKKVRQVEKITPSGLIRVSGLLYYPDGRERTSSIWHSSRLIPYNKEVQACPLQFRKDMRQLAGFLKKPTIQSMLLYMQ